MVSGRKYSAPVKLKFCLGTVSFMVHGCSDASVHFSGEDWVAVAVRTVSKQDRVLKSALTGKNGVALQAVSVGCQGHVANVQHVQFRELIREFPFRTADKLPSVCRKHVSCTIDSMQVLCYCNSSQ